MIEGADQTNLVDFYPNSPSCADGPLHTISVTRSDGVSVGVGNIGSNCHLCQSADPEAVTLFFTLKNLNEAASSLIP